MEPPHCSMPHSCMRIGMTAATSDYLMTWWTTKD
jgi:hypothetical protein